MNHGERGGGGGGRGCEQCGEDADGNGVSDPSHGRRRLGGRSHPCAWQSRARGRGRWHLRSTAWRATRPVSAAARDVAPDGPMSLRL